MCTAKSMTDIYEKNKEITSKYVHATSRGHEAVQIAMGIQLKPEDWVSPYYRDDALLLGIGVKPYELMLQLMAKKDDPFSGGRSYYSHPSLRRNDLPNIQRSPPRLSWEAQHKLLRVTRCSHRGDLLGLLPHGLRAAEAIARRGMQPARVLQPQNTHRNCQIINDRQ